MGLDANPGPGQDNIVEAQVLDDPRYRSAMASLDSLVAELKGKDRGLLELLRALERLHRSIQDGPFQEALPGERNQLYQLMQEIDRSGGWPYIPRPQLREFLKHLRPSRQVDPEEESVNPARPDG